MEVSQAVRKASATGCLHAPTAFLLHHFYRSPSHHRRLRRGTVTALQDGSVAMSGCLETDDGRLQAGFDGAALEDVRLHVTREMLLCVSHRAGEVR